VLKEYDIAAPCFALEIEPAGFAQTARRKASFRAIPKFPGAWRDIALVVPDGVTSEQVRDAIQKSGGPELKAVHLFDLYRGPHVAKGFRSLAYRMQFLNEERTLTDPEIVQKVSAITSHLQERYSIAIR
jgi:phenylalanyl-tRNA synthetase beta chain